MTGVGVSRMYRPLADTQSSFLLSPPSLYRPYLQRALYDFIPALLRFILGGSTVTGAPHALHLGRMNDNRSGASCHDVDPWQAGTSLPLFSLLPAASSEDIATSLYPGKTQSARIGRSPQVYLLVALTCM